jgi:hypothetical protein
LVSDGELAHLVSTLPPQRACVELVELAKARGGFDNITVAIIPMDGQLRSKPPAEAPGPKRRLTSQNIMRNFGSKAQSPLRTAMTLGIICMVTAAATVGAFLLWLGRQ